jgi:hypothetical protein
MKRILTISLLLLAVICTVSADRRRMLMTRNVASAAALREPDILEITFTNGSGLTVNSTVGPNATNNVATWITGKSGSGYALRGSFKTNLLMAAGNVTYSTGVVTVCAWVRLPVNGVECKFFGSDYDWNSYNAFSFEQSAAVTYLVTRQSGAGRIETQFARLPNTNWVHVAAVFNQTENSNIGTNKLYYDGVLQLGTNAVSTKTAGANFTARPFVATTSLSTSSRYDLDIDHIAVFTGELTQADIEAQGALSR